jgi:hypothetical protein
MMGKGSAELGSIETMHRILTASSMPAVFGRHLALPVSSAAARYVIKICKA